MPGNTSQIIGIKPSMPQNNTGCKKSGCKSFPNGGCIKEAEIAIIKNDIEKLKESARDSSDGKSIELNKEVKLQIKGFDTAANGSVVLKESNDSVKWVKPQLTAHKIAGTDDEYCLELQLN